MATVKHATLTSELAGGDKISAAEWDADHDISGLVAEDISGLATIATSGSASDLGSGTVPAARMPALTGDITTSAGAVATTLATVNAGVGSFGSATQSIQVTFNAKGLATAAANVTITPAVGSITGLGTGVATALGVNVGSAGAFVTFNGAGGTPSSLTLTNATGLPIAGLTASTVTAIGVGSIELGHATDTTITRVSAGNIAVEGNAIYRAGGTDVPITDGGTGASTASDARANLGVVIGTDVQAQNANLGAIAGLTTAADKVTYWTGSGTAATTDFTSVARTLVNQTTQALMRTTGLGLGTSATVNTGSSGATIPLLNAANTWSATQTFDGAIHWVNALIVRDSGGNPYIQFTGTAGANCGFFRATTAQVQLDAASGGAVNLSVNTSAIAVFSASLIDCTVPIVSNNSIKSNSATAGVGYATGAGGTVTQATSKSTGVTLNKVSGQITMHNASLAATTSVAFTLTNSAIAATDTLSLNIASGATSGAYVFGVQAVAAGSCSIFIRNVTAGALGEAVVFNFNIIKGVAA